MPTPRPAPRSGAELRAAAGRHLWPSFTRLAGLASDPGAGSGPGFPLIVRGDGVHVIDDHGRRYLDGLSGLFVSQLGHNRTDIAEVAAKQAADLAYFPVWSSLHPSAVELAERLAHLAPGDLNRVFFTGGGGEAVESAWKLAKNYFRVTGRPMKHKAISRQVAYHGTTHGALSITSVPRFKQQFEPLVPATARVPNTDVYRGLAPTDGQGHLGFADAAAFGRWAADEIAATIETEGPDTVAAVFIEPVQNAGGCFPPPPGYLQRVREICDAYDVLLVSDEVICAFGRIGHTFGSARYDYVPDIITCAKGMTAGYAPLGAMIVSDRVAEPFLAPDALFAHGFTFAGHPVATAVGLKVLDIYRDERVNEHVLAHEGAFRATLERLLDLPLVGDVRGAGFFWAIELVKDKTTRETFTKPEVQRLLYELIAPALLDAGLYCRSDDRGSPVIQLAPPLICTPVHFEEMERIVRHVLTDAENRWHA